MNRNSIMVLILCACFVSMAWSQQAANNDAVVPPLVNFTGVLTETNNMPMTGVVGVTFSLYTDQQGGAPLWLETQNLQPDGAGRYSVMLGSTLSQGLPSNLFSSGAARWLGVQMQGHAEQPRVLLVAVPYALKALDAETIGGKPASAFALATPAGTSVATNSVPPTGHNSSVLGSPSISGSGKPGYISEWLSTTKLGDSALFQSTAGNLGISTTAPSQKLEIDLGNMLVKGADNFLKSGDAAYVYVGDSNHSIEAIRASGLAIGTYQVPQAIFIQDRTGNVGMAANLTVNGNLSATGMVTGNSYQIGSNLFAFGSYANQNAFVGFAGNTTMTGVGNTANGYLALSENTSGYYNTATGLAALIHNSTGNYNTAAGQIALDQNTTGSDNTAIGDGALVNNISGSNNAAIGSCSLCLNSTGNYNTASGVAALNQNGTGNYNTALGYNANPASSNLTNATAIGANAVVGQSNALVLGGTSSSGYAVNVGIGTATPSNVLTIAEGSGQAISDGWATYSSRRWKSNIQPLQGAMAKVQQLRGVSYDLKANGKHEVGVIAEEVGAIVPEVVTWEENGMDAQSVDYGRLTALLIEATKEQQRDIRQEQAANSEQRRELAKSLRQIKQQGSLLRVQASAMQSLEMEVRETLETLRKVKAQVAAFQLTMMTVK